VYSEIGVKEMCEVNSLCFYYETAPGAITGELPPPSSLLNGQGGLIATIEKAVLHRPT